MCYGSGCRWEDSYGECTAPLSIFGCKWEEERCLVECEEEEGEEEDEGE